MPYFGNVTQGQKLPAALSLTSWWNCPKAGPSATAPRWACSVRPPHPAPGPRTCPRDLARDASTLGAGPPASLAPRATSCSVLGGRILL